MIRPNFFYLVSPFTLLHPGLYTLSMSGCNKCTILQIHEMRQRRICTTSHYKMTCECCGNTINRGDKITQVLGSKGRMRARHAPCASLRAAADAEDGCYTPYAYAPTRNQWVHLHCRPQYFKDWGNGSIGYFPIPTAYSHSIDQRIAAAAFDPDWGEDLFDIPRPNWKWETERLSKAILPVQRWWKKILTQKRWAEATARTVCTRRVNWEEHLKGTSGCWHWGLVGEHCEVLFNANTLNEAVYSGEIVRTQGLPGEVYLWVKYHHDGEVRRYSWEKYKILKKEIQHFKLKHDIKCVITGRLYTRQLNLQ